MSTVRERLVLGPQLAGTLMTPEEFDAVEDWDDLYVYELINGVLVVTPPPDIAERGPNDRLGQWLWNYKDQHPKGSALDYTVTEHTIRTRRNRRRADRVIWAGLGRLPDPQEDVPTPSSMSRQAAAAARAITRPSARNTRKSASRSIGSLTVLTAR